MSKSFENMAKIVDKILVHMDAVIFLTDFDKRKSDFTDFKIAIQAYKTTFDLFGSSSGSTGTNPTPTGLMANIKANLEKLNVLA